MPIEAKSLSASRAPRRRSASRPSASIAPADALSLHTRVTTESRALTLAAQSSDPVRAYLDIEALIAAAKASHCDCVHPGYGFLSENAGFAKRCLDEGIAFIGPRPETLALFGDKTKARELARSLGIPIIPGSPHALASAKDAIGRRRSDRLSGHAESGRRRRRARHARSRGRR